MADPEPNTSKFVLRTIRTIVGPDGMADLYAEKGGTEIFIPRECNADHWMSRLFGEEKANKICEHFNIINADGNVVGSVRCYLPIQNSRITALHEQIEEEVKQALIDGKAVRDIVREVGISERRVREHLRHLRQCGVIGTPVKSHGEPAAGRTAAQAYDFRRLRAAKLAKIDDLLIAGRTNRVVMLSAGVGVAIVRQRRKHLLAAGLLNVGFRAAETDYAGQDETYDFAVPHLREVNP